MLGRDWLAVWLSGGLGGPLSLTISDQTTGTRRTSTGRPRRKEIADSARAGLWGPPFTHEEFLYRLRLTCCEFSVLGLIGYGNVTWSGDRYRE